MVNAIVTAEGPVHVHEVERRALAHWDLTRSAGRARSAVQQAIKDAATRAELARDGAFLWPDAQREPAIRDRSQAGPREAKLIPPAEIRAALELVAHKELRVPADVLCKQAGKLLGFSRLGKKLERTFTAALDQAIASGALQRDADDVLPT